MALTATVTKGSVSQRPNNSWAVSLVLRLTENATTVLEQTFSATYVQGGDVPEIATALLGEMQAAIDTYKAEQALLNATAFDAVVANLNANLET